MQDTLSDNKRSSKLLYDYEHSRKPYEYGRKEGHGQMFNVWVLLSGFQEGHNTKENTK